MSIDDVAWELNTVFNVYKVFRIGGFDPHWFFKQFGNLFYSIWGYESAFWGTGESGEW